MDVASSERIEQDRDIVSVRLGIRGIGLSVVRLVGTKIIDQRTGESLGRALIVPWRGRVHVIGLETAVKVVWLPQQRLTYWKQEIGFATHPPVDFPNVRNEPPTAEPAVNETLE